MGGRGGRGVRRGREGEEGGEYEVGGRERREGKEEEKLFFHSLGTASHSAQRDPYHPIIVVRY